MLYVSAKFEEHCDRIPLYSQLNTFLHGNQYHGGQPYTARQYLQMELNILKFTNFELCVPTVPHFLPYFLQVGTPKSLMTVKDNLLNVTFMNSFCLNVVQPFCVLPID